MRVSFRWLREIVPDLSVTAEQVAERLVQVGLEVEGISEFGADLDHVVVAAVRKIEPHPNRERLHVVTIDTGKGEDRVVCGASNVPDPGGLVALAPLGTTLTSAGFTVEPRTIGGIQSTGMLCSESELGIAESSEGILVLPAGSGVPGTPVSRVLPEGRDTIFELGVTPNRPDALGHLGVARDLAAVFQIPLSEPAATVPFRTAQSSAKDRITVQIDEPDRCPIYACAIVDDVLIGPSPSWLRFRLYALGVRPISNVVDVTNLLLLESGQPMHAFDYDLVAGRRILVRCARPGEPFTTLDGVARRLDPDDLVICDGDGPTALAGVMGGQRSEIRPETTRVLLECAYFTPRGIRRTSRRHGLSTESSFRFERGVDFGGVSRVLDRAKSLLSSLASGAASADSVFAKGKPLEVPSVRLRSARLNALLGIEVPFTMATSILARLGFATEHVDDGPEGPTARIRGASFRPDITQEIDLIEEVARIRGLEAIPTVLPAILPAAPRQTGKLERRTLSAAVALGLSEAVTYSFVAEGDLKKLGAPPPVVTIKNPLSEDRSVLRTSLLPGLLDVLRRARRHGEHDMRVFAVGARFLPPGEGSASAARPRLAEDSGVLPEERPSFAALLAGNRSFHLTKPEELDVYDAKGIALELVSRIARREASVSPMTASERLPYLHPRGAAWITIGSQRVGALGPLHPDTVDAFDLGGPAQVIEVDLVAVEALSSPVPQYHPIPRLPAVSRDVAVVVTDALPAAEVEDAIRSAAGALCESVQLFDVFSGPSLGAGKRSLAYHVVYRDPKAATEPEGARTLTDDEVDRQHELVRKAMKQVGELRE